MDGRTVRFADGTAAQVDTIVRAKGFDLPTDFLPEELRPGPCTAASPIPTPTAYPTMNSASTPMFST